MNSTPTDTRPIFRKRHRLANDLDYKAVFDAKARKHAGPLTIFAKPNALQHHRLGLSIGRRFGNAVKRNALKRRLREAFRLNQHTIKGSYDIVVTTRPHPIKPTQQYATLFTDCAHQLHSLWSKRARTNHDSRTQQHP